MGDETMKINFSGNSLRFKFIAGFVIIILVLSLISIFTYVTMKSSMDKLDDMVQTTILANRISTISQQSTDSLGKYIQNQDENLKKQIEEGYAVINNSILQLK